MKLQGGDKTDDPFWDAGGDLGEAVVLRKIRLWQAVKASPDPLDGSLLQQTVDTLAG